MRNEKGENGKCEMLSEKEKGEKRKVGRERWERWGEPNLNIHIKITNNKNNNKR
jgi:hypothetical protein